MPSEVEQSDQPSVVWGPMPPESKAVEAAAGTPALTALMLCGFQEEEASLALERCGGAEASSAEREALLLLLALLAPAKVAAREALCVAREAPEAASAVAFAALEEYLDVGDSGSADTGQLESSAAEELLQEEVVALQAIFDEAFSLDEEELPPPSEELSTPLSPPRIMRLQLPDSAVPGELKLYLPSGSRYPSTAARPLFVPAEPGARSLAPACTCSGEHARSTMSQRWEQPSDRAKAHSLSLESRVSCLPLFLLGGGGAVRVCRC